MFDARTCSADAAVRCGEQTTSGRPRRGDFDPGWVSMALLGVASFLCLLVAPSGLQAQTVATSAPVTVEQRLDAALVAYERSHWPEAYAALSSLADSGHPEAARMALQMRQYGPALYGREFAASPGQVARWKRSLGCSGDVTGVGCKQALAVP